MTRAEHAAVCMRTQVGVFYCGPKPLGKALSALALRFSARRHATFHMRSEQF